MKRYLYIALLCACALFGSVGSAAAQFANGDIVTISGNGYYLALNEALDGFQNTVSILNASNIERCLWKVSKQGEQYSFTNVKNPSVHVRVNANCTYDRGWKWTINLQTTNQENNRSYFTFDGSNKIYYTATSNNQTTTCYVRCTNNGNWGAVNTNNYESNLTIHKWEYLAESGGIKVTVNPNSLVFTEFIDDGITETKSLEARIEVKNNKEYYRNLNTGTSVVVRDEATGDRLPDISSVSATWYSSKNAFSSANCQVYDEKASMNRQLLKIDGVNAAEDKKSCSISISTIGNSPMEMKDGDRWKDHSDVLTIAFRNADNSKDDTYYAYVDVVRYSFHQDNLPEFVINADHETIALNKESTAATVNISCIHQHGVKISHMAYEYGNQLTSTLVENICESGPTTITDLQFASFAAKSVTDETNVDWITLSHTTNGPANGQLSLSATNNDKGIARKARLVGTFNYTCSDNSSVKHTAFLEIPILQNAKDASQKLIHQRGYYNTEFGKNPYTNENEQLVHVTEKTIYYVAGQNITLTLAEKAFRGYKRWYDYETEDDPRYNAVASDRTDWVTVPQGDLIGTQNDYGDTYGVYDVQERDANAPIIKGWADGKAHIIACDLSNYKDYTTTDEAITEPTLSYRQLFHLRPASEIAQKFADLKEGEYLENYTYTAPTGTEIYLSTEFRYNSGTESDNCYFYYTDPVNKTGLTRVTNANWTGGGTTSGAFRVVSSNTATPANSAGTVYTLTANDGNVHIAKFTVKYVDKNTYGPVASELISRQEILDEYIMLEEINFNYSPLPTSNANNQQLYRPLPWGETTYGYYYPGGLDGLEYYTHSNRSGNDIPYYGEYMLVNSLNLQWAHQTNHGGGESGYVLYVDGTTEPGLVASISTDATVCSGQTMYCSMWLCNPSENRSNNNDNNYNNPENDYSNPIFRCNIQGRNKGDSEWKNVGMYFAGELEWGTRGNNAVGGSWHQVNFPIVSEVNYDETRVQIYNFGKGGSGNDFMVDDICLYVSPLPLAAYHATTGCTSYSNTETTNTVVVLRIDYDQLHEDQTDKNVYYHIYNVTDKQTVALKEKVKVGEEYQYRSIYYNEAGLTNIQDVLSIDTVGSIKIPRTRDGSGIAEKSSINEYIKELTPNKNETSKSGKCFIYDETTGKYFLYLVHVIPSKSGETGEDGVYLDREKTYSLRIANAYGDLYKAACVFTTELHAAQDTYVELRNDEVDSLRITGCMDNLCANNHHTLTVKVENTISPTTGGALQTISALVHADWLVGFESDDIYCEEKSIVETTRTVADASFKTNYGYERNEVEDAIVAMRDVSASNTNRFVTKAKDLKVRGDKFTQNHIDIITDLCNRGLLKLYQTREMFYLGSEAIARYWVYPVAEDATIVANGKTYTLTDCNEPKWVKVKSSYSEYAVNLSPINKENQTPQQRLEVPSIRIVEGTKKVVIPVQELTAKTNLYGTLSAIKDSVRFNYDEPIEHVLEYVDLSNNRIDIVEAPSTLVAGEEYLMRMAFYDELGRPYINGDPTKCRVGYIYFYLTIVPKTVQWTGESSAIWGDDSNWKGVKADGTLMDIGFAPLPESNVIIRALPTSIPYPIVTVDDHYPMDVFYRPNVCNKIYFEYGAIIHNQHLLEYKQAFVDMKISAANWNSMAPPLKGMYTGDMFVPHDGYNGANIKNLEYKSVNDHSEYPFAISPFKGTRTSKAPYVFWQSIYNKRATIYHENGNQSHPALTESAIFAQTNSLGQALPVGSGFQVLGFGPTHGTEDEILVRLPKPDDYYNYYYSNGTPSDQRAYVEHSSKLAFEPDANGDMYITLTNDLPSKQFMFGNPAMTHVDMKKFLEDPYNAQLAKKYYTMSNSSWNAETLPTVEQPGSGKLAPMRSVLLELASGEAKSITVKLSKTHLVGYTEPTPAGVVARKNVAEEEFGETQLMTIYATSEGGQARCMLASNAYAHDIYNSEEDALFISSGVEEGVNSATATSPVNMYTVSEQVPMMVDVREKIDTVPLSMLVHKSYRTEKVKFSFYLSLNWDKECYFCDAVTGERYRILDGLVLEMDMPQNHEVRYFIDGPDVIDPDGGGDIWSSTEDVKTSTNQVWAYSPSQGQLVVASNDIIKAVMVYDIAGRLIGYRELEMQYNSTTFDTPTGACIVKAVLRDNTEHYISALVK